jgi:hypothetical protein
MPPPPPPAPTSFKNKGPWPKRGSSSIGKQISVHTNYHGQGVSVSMRPIVVPKFLSDPSLPVQPGYQEAHELYDEMRQFFAQKAMSVHAGEVVVVKVTMMSWKPGNRNPSIVSVRRQTYVNCIQILILSYNRTYRKQYLIYLFTSVFEILRL